MYRPDTANGVTTGYTAHRYSSWTVVRTDSTVQLKSWKGDFLNRPDTDFWVSGVTTGPTGPGSAWAVSWDGNKTSFKSWKGDFLHRPDSYRGVTTWHTGIGNIWSVEFITSGKFSEKEISSKHISFRNIIFFQSVIN